MSYAELRDRAIALPLEEQENLLRVLFDAIKKNQDEAAPLSEEWQIEIQRRIDEIDSGSVEMIDGQVVMHEVRERLRLRGE